MFKYNIPKLEVLAALQSELLLGLASSALETKDNLLGGLSLLVEDRLGLTTVTTLLSVVTTLTLGEQGGLQRGFESVWCSQVIIDYGTNSHLASLVLGDLVLGVLVALLGLAVSPAGLGDVDLKAKNEFRIQAQVEMFQVGVSQVRVRNRGRRERMCSCAHVLVYCVLPYFVSFGVCICVSKRIECQSQPFISAVISIQSHNTEIVGRSSHFGN